MSCHIQFFQSEHRNVSKLCLDARYNRRNETNRKIKMLLAAFFPLPDAPTWSHLCSHSVPLFTYWSLTSLSY
ncbi:hypothetical protein T12_8230 [Trichinella patagoniensis]|uniref:Uncharacterized protein n=1 Tax=Trichinella patagoniensis TaxID=990121 RepID=A0A0V0ZYH4_9BILA|nr:hypothetical protein T12_8230 [Trichinella patagoniensis]